MLLSTLLLAAVLSTSSCSAARILALLPYNARSHFVVMEPLLLELQKRGHHLTVVSTFPQKRPLQNFTDIDLSSKLPSAVSSYSLSSIKDRMPNMFKTVIFIAEIHLNVCEKALEDSKVQALLGEKFDLVIGEIFGADCFNYIAYKLKVPFISWVTSKASPWMAERTGLPDNPSYIPNYFVDYDAKMSFLERVFNTITLVYAKAAYYICSDLQSHAIAERVFKEKLPPMDEVNRQTSLVLVNSHFSLAQSRPFPPNVVEVGGIHITETKALPKDLQQLLDRAKEGVILVSFGSLVRASSLPPRTIRMFLDVFATLPQTVIFKYEEDIQDAPPNVVARPWLPQADIIAHPNVRLVITHCGLASTIEAVHFAKPLVAVPFYSDQFGNARSVVRRGGGVILDLDTLSAQDISRGISTVLSDPSYTENMRRLSQQFRDRPLTALQTAVYWTEYVIRHQGAPHLRPASVHLPLYQYLLLDVIAVLLIALSAVLLVCYLIVRLITRMCLGMCRKRNKVVSKQKVKKSKKVN